MTDRLKGLLVTFDKDIREDDADCVLNAIRMIKNVLSVKPYITKGEDWMLYERGHRDATMKMMKLLMEEVKKPK